MLRMAVALGFATCLVAQAFAFGTKPGTHNVGSEHEKITRAAIKDLSPKTLDALAGAGEEPGAVGQADVAGAPEGSALAAHCGGGDYLSPDLLGGEPYGQTQEKAQSALESCRSYIESEINEAVRWARTLDIPKAHDTELNCQFEGKDEGMKCRVLEHLGRAFHAAQDFYAYSNWVDKPMAGPITAENPPGLGQSGRAAWLDLRRKQPVPEGLMTGCPGDLSLVGITIGCEYGSLPPVLGRFRVQRKDLDKGEGPIGLGRGGMGTTPRGKIHSNFSRAVTAAVEDTADKWAYFKDRLSTLYGRTRATKILCALQGDKFDLKTCTNAVIQAQACQARATYFNDTERTDEAPIAEPSGAEIAFAEFMLPKLAGYCVIEETDVTRTVVGLGQMSAEGRALAKERALKALATWGSCRADAAALHENSTKINKAKLKANRDNPKASKDEPGILADIYADCVLDAFIKRRGE